MSGLDPREMANKPSGCGEKMNKVLNVVVNVDEIRKKLVMTFLKSI